MSTTQLRAAQLPATRLPSRAPRQAAIMIPAAIGSAGVGVLAAESPILGAGIGAFALLSMLPWIALFAAFTVSALFNSVSINLGVVNFRFEELIMVPFAIRAYLLTRPSLRSKWEAPEWFVTVFIAVQFFVTLWRAQNLRTSLLNATLLGFGAVTYLAVYASTCTRKRLRQATRLFLLAVVIDSLSGIAALVSHYALGTTWGIKSYLLLGGVPTTYGLAWERDIFGSTSAAGALIFLSLWRENNPLVTKRQALLGFWICGIALAVSLTRGAWIGFAVGAVVMFLLPRRGIRRHGGLERAALVLVFMALLPLAVLALGKEADSSGPIAGVAHQTGRILDFQSGSGATRAAQWRTALAEWERSPLFGYGTNSYGVRHFRNKEGVRYPAYIGNLYVRTLYDSGLLGLGMLVLFLAGVLWPSRYLLVSRGDLAPVARALTFGWVGLAVAFISTDSVLLIWPWILLGLVRAARHLASDQFNERRAAATRRPVEANGGGTVEGLNGHGRARGWNGGGDGRPLSLGPGRLPIR